MAKKEIVKTGMSWRAKFAMFAIIGAFLFALLGVGARAFDTYVHIGKIDEISQCATDEKSR